MRGQGGFVGIGTVICVGLAPSGFCVFSLACLARHKERHERNVQPTQAVVHSAFLKPASVELAVSGSRRLPVRPDRGTVFPENRRKSARISRPLFLHSVAQNKCLPRTNPHLTKSQQGRKEKDTLALLCDLNPLCQLLAPLAVEGTIHEEFCAFD